MLEGLNLPSNFFLGLSIILLVATILAYLIRLLKQPLIPAYVLAGILIGPFGLGIIQETELIRTMAEIGIAFLLFTVGLEIDIKRLKDIGWISSIGAFIQVAFIFFITYLIFINLGFANMNSVYLGLIAAFSSTMVVLKLLSDKNELDTLHGRLILGFLLVQDVIVILVLSFLGGIGNFTISLFGINILRGIGLLFLTWLSAKFILPYLFRISARSDELLFLSSISVCFVFAWIAYFFGFSIAIGAFLAGLSLTNLPYHFDISGKITPLKNFFAILFFVSLGMELYFNNFLVLLIPLVILLFIVLFAKPLIVMILSSILGYKKRTSFLTAISLGQISEFSLILASFGMTMGHVSNDVLTLTVLLAIITITLTSYIIQFDNRIYNVFRNFINFFESISLSDREKEHFPENIKKEIIIFGAHRMGHIFVNAFAKAEKNFLVVDFNPGIIKNLIANKIPCVYGDLANHEILKRLNIEAAKMVISTVPNYEDSLFLIKYAKQINPKIILILTANQIGEAIHLYETGADYVILPHILTGNMMINNIKRLMKHKSDIHELRKEHMKMLKKDRVY